MSQWLASMAKNSPGARADHAEDAQAHVIAVLDALGFGSLERQTPPWFRLAFDAGFIAVPQIAFRIGAERLDPLAEGFAGRFVLSIGPGSRDFEHEAFFVEQAQQGLVGALDAILLGDVPVEGLGAGEGLGAFLGFFQFFDNLLGLFAGNLARSPRAFPDDQAVDSTLVECPDPLPDSAVAAFDGAADRLTLDARDEHDDGHTTALGLVGARAHGSVQVCQRGVFGIGLGKGPGHGNKHGNNVQ